MPLWITSDIVKSLEKIPGIKSVESQGQDGSYDTDNLFIALKGTSDNLFVAGFDPESDNGIQPDNVMISLVELTDGLDSRGGLNSRNKKTGQCYINIRQCLIDMGFDVVPSLKSYF